MGLSLIKQLLVILKTVVTLLHCWYFLTKAVIVYLPVFAQVPTHYHYTVMVCFSVQSVFLPQCASDLFPPMCSLVAIHITHEILIAC